MVFSRGIIPLWVFCFARDLFRKLVGTLWDHAHEVIAIDERHETRAA
jgi:hypothetical protein